MRRGLIVFQWDLQHVDDGCYNCVFSASSLRSLEKSLQNLAPQDYLGGLNSEQCSRHREHLISYSDSGYFRVFATRLSRIILVHQVLINSSSLQRCRHEDGWAVAVKWRSNRIVCILIHMGVPVG